MKKLQIRKIITLLISLFILSFLSACGNGSNNGNKNSTSNRSVTKIPAPLQKLAIGDGTLNAYIQLDGSSVRIPMLINLEGNGTASAVLPGLTRDEHNVLITYEYTDNQGSLILAQTNKVVDLSSGSGNLNIEAEDYSLAFDKDSDGVNNTNELLVGSDPRTPSFSGPTLLLRINADIPKRITDNINTDQLRAFITLDDENNSRFEMILTTNSANLNIPNLNNINYTLIINYEYTDNNGTVILATANREVNLRFGGETIIVNDNEFIFITLDDDNDGTYNIDEIIRDSNPIIANIPIAPIVNLAYEGVKTFQFTWEDVGGDAIFYQLLENSDGSSGFEQVGSNIPANTQIINHVVTLYDRQNAQYILRSCNKEGCSDSATLNISGSLAGSVGYFKIGQNDEAMIMGMSGDGNTLAMKRINGDITIFNNSTGRWREQAVIANPYSFGILFTSTPRIGDISLSADGSTLAFYVDDDRIGNGVNSTITTTVTTGITPLSADTGFGSVYVFIRIGDNWQQQAYIKASNPDLQDRFGTQTSLSDNGNTLAIGACGEASNAKGTAPTIDQLDNRLNNAGATYVFTRTDTGLWSQQSYIKASNTGVNDRFCSVNLSGDGLTLAVGALNERSSQTGIIQGDGLQIPTNNDILGAGAVYLFKFNQQLSTWSQEAYIKSSTPETNGFFGRHVSLSRDGNILAVTAENEKGVDPNNSSLPGFGGVYIFERTSNGWARQSYIKNVIRSLTTFGSSASLSNDGNMIAIGARSESSNAVGLNGEQTDIGFASGAAYIFTRDTNIWNLQTYIKASNTEILDGFGVDVILSNDGGVLAVKAPGEDSNTTGINGEQSNNEAPDSGAVYLY